MATTYDVIIAGGGLAGLTAGCLLGPDFKVLIIDPDSYPRHKLCGEYLSVEILPILEHLGIDIYKDQGAKRINKFIYTNREKSIKTSLPLGGMGVSRYSLDNQLYTVASQNCKFKKSKVTNVVSKDGLFEIITEQEQLTAKQFIMATGKRSLLDKKLDRSFIKHKSPWMAVKMHYKASFKNDEVGLHSFYGGYAGLSMIENGDVNLCYLAHTNRFKKFKNIDLFNKEVLGKNQVLKEFLNNSTPVWDKPISISQISFDSKNPVENGILMIGDTAGLIHPLCGNGMAMAIHSAYLASRELKPFLQNDTSREVALKNYEGIWKATFSKRMFFGKMIQVILINPRLSTFMFSILSRLPFLLRFLIQTTHGKMVRL